MSALLLALLACDLEPEPVASCGEVTWYVDADADGYGDAALVDDGCATLPAGYAEAGGDCDDAEAATFPGAAEACDGADNDCDGLVETAPPVWGYADADGDGFGGAYGEWCDTVTQDAGDCDDADASAHPGADEHCDDRDEDCDGAVDEDATDATAWYADLDEDGWTAGEFVGCDPGAGWVTVGSAEPDCDDTQATAHPDADERCDGEDDDCDGDVDEGATDALAWYADVDGDGYGGLVATFACDPPDATSTGVTGDCDDGDATAHPGGTEVCDAADTDEDCDGAADDADARPWGRTLFYRDADGDGFGATAVYACDASGSVVPTDGDCDDADAATWPAAPEVMGDGIDQDCDGEDERVVVTHCGTISADETWSGNALHEVTCDVYVEGASRPLLTIEDGAEVEVALGVGISIGVWNYGELLVDGSSRGVTFTSSASRPRAGDWDGLYFGAYTGTAEISGATIAYGGGNGLGDVSAYNAELSISDSVLSDSSTAGLYLSWGSSAAVYDTRIEDNATWGVYVHDYASLDGDGSFAGNVVSDNDVGMRIPAADGGALTDDGTYSGNVSDDVTLASDTVEVDTTFRALDVPWHVLGDVNVAGSAHPRLTIEDGAELLFDSGAGLSAGSGTYGALDIRGGTAGVTLGSAAATPAPGDWDGVYLGWFNEDSSIVGAEITHAGANGFAAVYLYAASMSGGSLTMDDCTVSDSSAGGIYAEFSEDLAITDTTIRDNADDGVYLDGYSALAAGVAFSGNTITGNGLYPLLLPAPSLTGLDGTGTFAGNGIDRVYVRGGYVVTTGTWPALDADYLFTGTTWIHGSASPVITVEPGATLRFDRNALVEVGWWSPGALVAVGTATAPIVFTSAQAAPAAGDWTGLRFEPSDTGSELRNVTVEYGGSSYGNIYLWLNGSTVTIADSTIASSATWGIYRDGGATPTLSGNTYTGNVAGEVR